MIRRVTPWLSFWNADTRRQLEEELHGEVLGSIYVPFGKGDTTFALARAVGTPI